MKTNSDEEIPESHNVERKNKHFRIIFLFFFFHFFRSSIQHHIRSMLNVDTMADFIDLICILCSTHWMGFVQVSTGIVTKSQNQMNSNSGFHGIHHRLCSIGNASYILSHHQRLFECLTGLDSRKRITNRQTFYSPVQRIPRKNNNSS